MLRLGGAGDAERGGRPNRPAHLNQGIGVVVVTLVDHVAKRPGGYYHGTSSGQTSWCGFTHEIFRLSGWDPGV